MARKGDNSQILVRFQIPECRFSGGFSSYNEYLNLLRRVFGVTEHHLKRSMITNEHGNRVAVIECTPFQFSLFIIERNKMIANGSEIQNMIAELRADIFTLEPKTPQPTPVKAYVNATAAFSVVEGRR